MVFNKIGVEPIIGVKVPYTAKLSQLCTKHYLLENFRSASGPCHYVLYTVNDSRGKLLRLVKKPRKFSPSKVLPYTVLYINWNPFC